MSVEIRDDTGRVVADGKAKAALALRLMLDDIDRISEPGTPKKLGDLRRNKLKQVLGLHGSIQWRQKYAAKQEDRQARNYTTPGTGPHYAENAVKKVVRNSQTYFRKVGI